MADKDNKSGGTLNLSGGGTLGLKTPVTPNRAGGGRKTVTVEVKRRRGGVVATKTADGLRPTLSTGAPKKTVSVPKGKAAAEIKAESTLSSAEQEARLKALQQAGSQNARADSEELRVIKKTYQEQPEIEASETSETGSEQPVAETKSEDVVEQPKIAEARTVKAPESPSIFKPAPLKKLVRRFDEKIEPPKPKPATAAAPTAKANPANKFKSAPAPQTEEEKRKSRLSPPKARVDSGRRQRKITLTKALDGDDDRQRSLASVKRRREKQKNQLEGGEQAPKISREVVVPDVITVQELANRMAERTADVVKTLMKNGIMATATQSIDNDTAQLVAEEFGHTVKRVSESDVEDVLEFEPDAADTLKPRPPVVTIMGHVDHGKTSLLDAMRQTDVAGREAGGITQHIGAYQIQTKDKKRISFIDTPGHAAFTEMRARGANATDIVVLVVAADDGVMPQTIEAISHSKAAGVPIIVAINKIDTPGADPNRIKTALLSHEVIVEDMGGDILCVEVSALKKTNLDKLQEAILLQAELLDLKANPDRRAQGTVIEAQLDQGRGSVATVLVQHGTLKVGDIFVAGAQWGKVRALVDERNKRLKLATPSTPVEVLGLNATPQAGDDFVVVENEAKAREISEFRQRKMREGQGVAANSMEALMAHVSGENKQRDECNIVLKADVHGSLEAIRTSLEKLEHDEVTVKILFAGVGSITESDVTLARASNANIFAFNVRANQQAKEAAKRDGLEVRYYNIIYDMIDDVKAILSGMLAPEVRENFIGYAEIREVFNITKVGKIAGSYVTEGIIKRGCGVRLLRDNVVIHEGKLKTLKRFKDEVKDVKENFECGLAFENYQDMRVGDVVECFEVQEIARQL